MSSYVIQNKHQPQQSRSVWPNISEKSVSSSLKGSPVAQSPRVKEASICHGRVKNLGSKVPSQWWKTVFGDAMYLKTDGDVVEDPEITREEIALLEANPSIKQLFLRGSESGNNSDDDSSVDGNV